MRKVRLSKTKASKFNESGQLVAFYLASISAAVVLFRDVIIQLFLHFVAKSKNCIKILGRILPITELFLEWLSTRGP